MKRLFLVIFWILIGFSCVFGAWFVLHGDIQYTSDVARDFMLLRQISQKGIVLIGPSSSTKLYHGILWMYLNYPAFALSRGNPVVIGWLWVLLSAGSVVGSFYVAKKLFSTASAYFYALFLALFLAFRVRFLYNPDGVMLIIPFIFFSFVQYLKTKKLRFLIIHILLLGAAIQFEMAIGVPFVILSFTYLTYRAIKEKKYKQLLWFLLLPLTQVNFLIFDLRHQFFITKIAFHFLTSAGRDHINIFSMIWQRILFMVGSVEFSKTNPWGIINPLMMVLLFIGIFLQIKAKKFVKEYKLFVYFYVGFFVLSLANAGGLLSFYVYPLFPLVFLIFASFIESKQKLIFLGLFICLYISNMQAAYQDMQLENNLVGNGRDSWAFYNKLAKDVFNQSENSFGYFAFDPDIVAFQPKYALLYYANLSPKSTSYLTKKPVTYLVIAYNIYHGEIYWTRNQLHIEGQPKNIHTYLNGYKVEKYELSGKDLTTPIEPNLDPGVMFR